MYVKSPSSSTAKTNANKNQLKGLGMISLNPVIQLMMKMLFTKPEPSPQPSTNLQSKKYPIWICLMEIYYHTRGQVSVSINADPVYSRNTSHK